MSGPAKDYNRLVKLAEQKGCRVIRTGTHVKIRLSNGRIIVAAKNPSDHRAILNLRARLRRGGVDV